VLDHIAYEDECLKEPERTVTCQRGSICVKKKCTYSSKSPIRPLVSHISEFTRVSDIRQYKTINKMMPRSTSHNEDINRCSPSSTLGWCIFSYTHSFVMEYIHASIVTLA
jgi:hypothetical protein